MYEEKKHELLDRGIGSDPARRRTLEGIQLGGGLGRGV
jgi:hypothetical protein